MPDLKTLHHDLLEMLDALEAMTARASPDEAALAALRYRLTRTSTARRRCVEALCTDVEPRLSEEAARDVRALRESVATGFATSSGHIASWSMRRVLSDWTGYCRASFVVRRTMREQIAREQAVLYPYLDG